MLFFFFPHKALTQGSVVPHTGGRVWSESGLAVFLASPCKSSSGSDTRRDEVNLFGCLGMNSFWETRQYQREGRCSIKNAGRRYIAEGSPPDSSAAMSIHRMLEQSNGK